MSVTLKKSQFKYKDSQTGNYVSIDAIAEKSTADYVSEINGIGQQNVTAIQNKGAQVINSIPSDYTAFQDDVIEEFDVTKAYPAGKYVRNGDYFYCLTNGHEANVTFANTTKRQIVVTNEMSDIKSALDSLTDEEKLFNSSIPGTMEMVTFSGGKPSSVAHTANGSAVRTDTFVWTDTTVTETRTLANGKYVTMATDLTTLVTEISEIQEAA